MDFKLYLGKNNTVLNSAKIEQDEMARSELFRSLGLKVIDSGYLTPGWRVKTFELKKKTLSYIDFQTRYTPRLINYSVSKQNGD